MTFEEAVETAAWMQCIFADINDDQAAVWRDQFTGDLYRVNDVRKAASELRPHVQFFDPMRFTAIWNRIRIESLSPEQRAEAAQQALRKAIDEQNQKPERVMSAAILARKAEIEKRIHELGQQERIELAQKAINRLPEVLRNLYERVGFLQRSDPFEVASIREEAGAILGVA